MLRGFPVSAAASVCSDYDLQIKEEDAKRIVGLPVADLQKALHGGDISAVKVLHAYQYKAVQENEGVNFICEPVMEAQVLSHCSYQHGRRSVTFSQIN